MVQKKKTLKLGMCDILGFSERRPQGAIFEVKAKLKCRPQDGREGSTMGYLPRKLKTRSRAGPSDLQILQSAKPD